MPDRIFDRPLPECAYTEVPDNKTRSIFTWSHPINDYRAYIENMALCGQMYRSLDKDYPQTLRKTARRAWISTE